LIPSFVFLITVKWVTGVVPAFLIIWHTSLLAPTFPPPAPYVQEMYARGFEFVPIDLYTAKAQRFQIVDGKLMPSLATIDGLGDKAADAVVDAAKQGKFLSKDDFRDRTKVSKTVIDLMDDLKLFGDIPQSNQMSLFDFTG
jgi:DNA polymerase-3 subunit alpha (Gram-positive type)